MSVYISVDKCGDIMNFMLGEKRDKIAPKAF